MIASKTILITGGTGSLGGTLVTECLSRKAGKVIVFSRDEAKQQDMRRGNKDKRLRFFLGDVRDRARLTRALAGVDYVIHCAALKHVDVCEYNPIEAIKTNVGGAQNLIEAAIDTGVKKVLAVSSDKAVNPCNLYGASKLCADKLFIAGNAYSGAKGTQFSVIRYGNFIGSRGSVFEYFERLASKGLPLPITSKDMTRFWIEIHEAACRALMAVEMMEGGEIFTPKMRAAKLVDMVRERWSSAVCTETGIRPGEKLHEDLISSQDAYRTGELLGWYITYPDGVEVKGEKVAKGFSYTSEGNDNGR